MTSLLCVLLSAGRQLLGGAQGSFGLVLSHSLDCTRDLVVAARGQTMSIAFYPQSGLVAFGSESAATKVGMGAAGEDASFRFDLNDGMRCHRTNELPLCVAIPLMSSSYALPSH